MRYIQLVILIILGLAIWGLSWPIGFLGDDLRYLYEIEKIGSFADAINYVWQPLGIAMAWRPLVNLSWLIDYSLFHYQSWGYHFTNILLGFGCAALLYFIVRALSSRRIALTAAIIFCVFPFHLENLLWLSGRTDSLGLFFSLLALWWFVGYRQNRRPAYLIGSALAFALGLLSKEFAIVTPAIALVFHLYLRFKDQVAWKKELRVWPWYAAVIAVTGGYLYLRQKMLGSLVASDASIAGNYSLIPQASELRALWRATTLWFNYSSLREHIGWLYDFWSSYRTPVVLAFLAGLFVIALKAPLRKGAFFGALIPPLALLALYVWPQLSLIPAITDELKHSRFLFAPSVGIAWALALLLDRARGRKYFLSAIIIFASVGLVINIIPWYQAATERDRVVADFIAVAPEGDKKIWVNLPLDDYQGAYIFQDYYSFEKAVKIAGRPELAQNIVRVGNKPVADSPFCDSPDQQLTVLDWNGEAFTQNADLITQWSDYPDNPAPEWEAQNVTLTTDSAGTTHLDNFGMNPYLKLKNLPATGIYWKELKVEYTTTGPEPIQLELEWPERNRIILKQPSPVSFPTCQYPHWVTSVPQAEVLIKFPAQYPGEVDLKITDPEQVAKALALKEQQEKERQEAEANRLAEEEAAREAEEARLAQEKEKKTSEDKPAVADEPAPAPEPTPEPDPDSEADTQIDTGSGDSTMSDSGYSTPTVGVDGQNITVLVVAASMSNTRVIVDTASATDCSSGCPVLPLATYVSRNGAFAGVNGNYFMPYDGSNSYDVMVMNKDKYCFNEKHNFASNNPLAVFYPGSMAFVRGPFWDGCDTSADSALMNYPMLVSGGAARGQSSDPKISATKSNRSFVGNKGSIAYIGVVRSATSIEAGKALQALGLENALGLDAGGSTALWYGGYKAGPGRGLPTAILFVGR